MSLLAVAYGADSDQPFAIHVVDDQTNRGVPLVELKTTSNVVYVTDSNGIVAFDEPGLMNQKVWFTVKGHGYELPKDGFGLRGRSLDVTPGGQTTIKIKRLNIAQRLYRVTGSGIYRDSVLVRRWSPDPAETPTADLPPVPIEQPLLNAKVTGCDSVQTAIYGGKLRWFWGDTVRPAHPLGLFHVPGAVSDLPADGGLSPDQGINLKYFIGQDGFARATCQMEGDGPTWIDAVTVVPDASGKEVLLGAYVKIKPPLSIYRRGICRWNDEKNEFEHVAEMPLDAPVIPFGHTFVREESGKKYVYFGDPFPVARVPATAEAFVDLTNYEAYAFDAASDPQWAWRKNAAPTDAMAESKLIHSGRLKPEGARFRTVDADGKPVVAHRGSVNWNDYRKKWIAIFTQYGGTSMIGEIWYAEAGAPTGPWNKAVKIVTHDKYSFYNPLHHRYFDGDGGRVIYFEGTYTHTFSGNDDQTPRYDYNQVMYKLELDDPRLKVAR